MGDVAVVGIDHGKSGCSVAALSAEGRVVVSRQAARGGIAAVLAQLPPCVVAMEACCGAHPVGRSAVALRHQVRLIPPQSVRPYVRVRKTDDRDAGATADSATGLMMWFVPLKSQAQR